MNVETRIFEIVYIFCFLVGVIYAIIPGSEWVGISGLFLTGGMCLIIGTYLRFASRRIEVMRPEDNPDAEISDGAGDIGFFSPGSYWPLAVAGAAALLAISLAFFLIWAVVISIVLLLLAIGGFLFEYHMPPAHH